MDECIMPMNKHINPACLTGKRLCVSWYARYKVRIVQFTIEKEQKGKIPHSAQLGESCHALIIMICT